MQLPITKQFVYCLSYAFNTITIVKPGCSRLANSERYIIAQDFNGNYVDAILEILRRLIINGNIDSNTVIFDKQFQCSKQILDIIDAYNESHFKMQIYAIQKCLSLIDTAVSTCATNGELPPKVVEDITRFQIYHSKEWCLKYNVELNPKCKFYV